MKELNDEGINNLIEALIVDSFSVRVCCEKGQDQKAVAEEWRNHRIDFINSDWLDLYLSANGLDIDTTTLQDACRQLQFGELNKESLRGLGINFSGTNDKIHPDL